MKSFLSKNLSKILENKSSTEKFYSEIFDGEESAGFIVEVDDNGAVDVYKVEYMGDKLDD